MARKSPAHRTPIRNRVLLVVLAICCAVVVIVAIPSRPNPHIVMNHMLAAHSAFELIAAERQHAAKFPAAGFTCDLRQLGQEGMVGEVLASGERVGYHFELHGCETTATVTSFSLAAIPVAQGRTGEFAFCANQEGVLWYANSGSADECFKARTRWPRSDPLSN